jgi:hypothetical protein
VTPSALPISFGKPSVTSAVNGSQATDPAPSAGSGESSSFAGALENAGREARQQPGPRNTGESSGRGEKPTPQAQTKGSGGSGLANSQAQPTDDHAVVAGDAPTQTPAGPEHRAPAGKTFNVTTSAPSAAPGSDSGESQPAAAGNPLPLKSAPFSWASQESAAPPNIEWIGSGDTDLSGDVATAILVDHEGQRPEQQGTEEQTALKLTPMLRGTDGSREISVEVGHADPRLRPSRPAIVPTSPRVSDRLAANSPLTGAANAATLGAATLGAPGPAALLVPVADSDAHESTLDLDAPLSSGFSITHTGTDALKEVAAVVDTESGAENASNHVAGGNDGASGGDHTPVATETSDILPVSITGGPASLPAAAAGNTAAAERTAPAGQTPSIHDTGLSDDNSPVQLQSSPHTRPGPQTLPLGHVAAEAVASTEALAGTTDSAVLGDRAAVNAGKTPATATGNAMTAAASSATGNASATVAGTPAATPASTTGGSINAAASTPTLVDGPVVGAPASSAPADSGTTAASSATPASSATLAGRTASATNTTQAAGASTEGVSGKKNAAQPATPTVSTRQETAAAGPARSDGWALQAPTRSDAAATGPADPSLRAAESTGNPSSATTPERGTTTAEPSLRGRAVRSRRIRANALTTDRSAADSATTAPDSEVEARPGRLSLSSGQSRDSRSQGLSFASATAEPPPAPQQRPVFSLRSLYEARLAPEPSATGGPSSSGPLTDITSVTDAAAATPRTSEDGVSGHTGQGRLREPSSDSVTAPRVRPGSTPAHALPPTGTQAVRLETSSASQQIDLDGAESSLAPPSDSVEAPEPRQESEKSDSQGEVKSGHSGQSGTSFSGGSDQGDKGKPSAQSAAPLGVQPLDEAAPVFEALSVDPMAADPMADTSRRMDARVLEVLDGWFGDVPQGTAETTGAGRGPRGTVASAWLRAVRTSMNTQAAEKDPSAWKEVTIELEDGLGSLSIRARRDSDQLTLQIQTTDPATGSRLSSATDRIESELRDRYGAEVDLSFASHSDGDEQEQAANAGSRSGVSGLADRSRSDSIESEDSASRRGADRVWVG